jgi:hypothetical protein
VMRDAISADCSGVGAGSMSSWIQLVSDNQRHRDSGYEEHTGERVMGR